jgi:hypothetical protein
MVFCIPHYSWQGTKHRIQEAVQHAKSKETERPTKSTMLNTIY